MILSDRDIARYVRSGKIVISPYSDIYLQPASYDLHLASKLLLYSSNPTISAYDYNNLQAQYIDTDNSACFTEHEIDLNLGFVLWPQQCVLARTIEYFEFPKDVVGRMEGISSNGRIFLICHSTAGFFDPEFKGSATLEITNLSPRKTVLYFGNRIGQMSFHLLLSPSSGYRGRYQGQIDATPTKMANQELIGQREG